MLNISLKYYSPEPLGSGGGAILFENYCRWKSNVEFNKMKYDQNDDILLKDPKCTWNEYTAQMSSKKESSIHMNHSVADDISRG